MQALWTFRNIKRAVGVTSHGQDFDISGISIDSRTVQEGDLFIALQDKSDGHDYIADAYAQGAIAALVSREVADCQIPQIIVPDTFKALWNLAESRRYDFNETDTKIIAITGSCGKTTTKEFIADALGAHRSVGSYNNHWGVPLSLARMKLDEKFGVFELGMSHAGEILPLAKLVRPHIGVITNVALAHAEAFADINDIAVEKISLEQGLEPNGKMVVFRAVFDNFKAYFDNLPITYNLKGRDSDVTVETATQSITGQSVVANVCGQIVSFSLGMHGEHIIDNALACLAVTNLLGRDVKQASQALESIMPTQGRGNLHEVNGIYIIDESYNANPASMQAELKAFSKRLGGGKKIAILGDMLELGDDSHELHKELSKNCVGLDMVVTVGSETEALHNALPDSIARSHFKRQDEVNLTKLFNRLEIGDMLMVKGSNGIFYQRNFVARLVKELEKYQEKLKQNKSDRREKIA